MRRWLSPQNETLHLWLACVFVLGALLRLYNLPSQSYWMDEGYTVVATQAISLRGAPILNSGIIYHCPLYCYPSAALTKIFGIDNPLSYRLLAALFGSALILLVYFLGETLFNRQVGIFAALATSLSYIQIAWSRQARWYTEFEFFFWFAVFAFYSGRRSSRPWVWWILSAVAAVLAVKTHGLGTLLPAILLVWTLGEAILQKSRRLLLASAAAILVGLGAALVLGFFNTTTLTSLTAMVEPHNWFYYYVSFAWRTQWALILLALAGIIFVQGKRYEIGLLLSVVFAYLLPLAFLARTIEYRYLLHATIALYLLAALGLTLLLQAIRTVSPRHGTLMAYVFAALACIVLLANSELILLPQAQYFLESDDPSSLPGRAYYAYTPQPDWKNAYAFVASHLQPKDTVISTQPQLTEIYLHQAGIWLGYDYLGGGAPPPRTSDNRDIYAGAPTILTLPELERVARNSHGYLLIDYMATDDRISKTIQNYIRTHFAEVYYERTAYYSKLWVYRF